MKLVVRHLTLVEPEVDSGTAVIDYVELKSRAVSGELLGSLFRYSSVEAITYRFDALGRLLPIAMVLRMLSRGRCVIRDESGFEQRVGLVYLAGLLLNFVRDGLTSLALVRRVAEAADSQPDLHSRLELRDSPLYLRTDFAFGIVSGGSLGHIAGVINNLEHFGGAPVYVGSDHIPTIDPRIERHVVWPQPRFRDFGELWSAAYNEHFLQVAHSILGDRRLSFIYQRYSHNNHCGLALSRVNRVPLVLEYNGSEVWVARHWGRPFKYEALAEKIELANLRGAELIVVISKASRDELVERGIPADKILVNPNGVDPDTYRPDVDGSEVRSRLNLEGKTVIGFIGTFGRWHGAEVLADAFGKLLDARPELRDSARLLMVGDGVTMPEVRSAIERHGVHEQVVLTGLVPQAAGPAHLAAMDILASPHVPNADGTPFFGSPTKLFEYMAMGRGIVASDLDQIGEVLNHDVTAWMVQPGDTDSLADGLAVLIDDPERRRRLGTAARQEALAKHTWLEHTRRIVEALKVRCGR